MPYTPPSPGSKIIIVGGGAFGLSTAYALSLKEKYDVWVYERQPIPCSDAASTDINKIVRMDYADETMYMQLTMEALPMWRQWNKERAAKGLSPVYHETGVVLLSQNGQLSDYEQSSMKHIREAGYGHVIEPLLTPEKIVAHFPHLKAAVDHGFNIGYLNKEGGWCNSAEAVKHIYSKCVENGVHFVIGDQAGAMKKLYCDPAHPGKVLGIETLDGKIHKADRVILATGSWTASLVDMKGKLVATGQTAVHFQLPDTLRKQFENQPVWCADLSVTGYYGFAVNADGRMKVGHHSKGYLSPRQDGVSVPRTQVDNPNDTIPAKALREMRAFLNKFFPFTSTLDICYSRVCWYSDSIDGHFLVTPHPDYENLIVASGDSGHGMKFIPNIGFKICHVIEGVDSDWSRAWAWRDMPDNATYDGLRAKSGAQEQLSLGVGEARMVSTEELRANKSRM